MKKLVHEADGYSVVFTHGTKYFALKADGAAGRAFFRKRRDAVAFKRDLAGHYMQTEVVKVRVRMETMT